MPGSGNNRSVNPSILVPENAVRQDWPFHLHGVARLHSLASGPGSGSGDGLLLACLQALRRVWKHRARPKGRAHTLWSEAYLTVAGAQMDRFPALGGTTHTAHRGHTLSCALAKAIGEYSDGGRFRVLSAKRPAADSTSEQGAVARAKSPSTVCAAQRCVKRYGNDAGAVIRL